MQAFVKRWGIGSIEMGEEMVGRAKVGQELLSRTCYCTSPTLQSKTEVPVVFP